MQRKNKFSSSYGGKQKPVLTEESKSFYCLVFTSNTDSSPKNTDLYQFHTYENNAELQEDNLVCCFLLAKTKHNIESSNSALS